MLMRVKHSADTPANPCVTCRPLIQCLADAQNHIEAGSQGNSYLLVDERIGLAKRVPALAVAEDHVFAAQIDEHCRTDFAGERAFRLGIEVLRPQRDSAALEKLSDKAQIGERRTHGDADACFTAQPIDDRLGQLSGFGRGGVHLPVTDDELLAHIFLSPIGYSSAPRSG